MFCWRGQDLAVQVAQAILAIYFSVSNGVTLPAITLRTVTPPELGQKWKVLVIDKSQLTLGECNLLH
jgi:hypothetical protein